jgi:hypothetical protein
MFLHILHFCFVLLLNSYLQLNYGYNDEMNAYSEPKRRSIVVGLAFHHCRSFKFSPHHPFSSPTPPLPSTFFDAHDTTNAYSEPKRHLIVVGLACSPLRLFLPHHRPFSMPSRRGRIQRAQTTFDRRWARLFTTTALFHHTTHFHYHHDAT